MTQRYAYFLHYILPVVSLYLSLHLACEVHLQSPLSLSLQKNWIDLIYCPTIYKYENWFTILYDKYIIYM